MKIYAADWVLPISSAPIEKGAIAFDSKGIVAVGTQHAIAEKFSEIVIKDFGSAAILPGFVNAHAHLELTAMRGYLDSVENEFSTWLLKLATARDQIMSAEDVENSALCGAIEAVRAGVTSIGDIGKHAFAGAKALSQIGLRGISYQENSFALDENLAQEKFTELREKVSVNGQFETNLLKIGVTPHAPYTVSRKLFEMLTDFSISENLPVTIHAAESKAEEELMHYGTGNIASVLKNLGLSWEAPKSSTIQYLDKIGVLKTKPLLAHCINVNDQDLEIIHATGTKIAHCPKSNAKFAHGIAPFAEMLAKNVIVGFGSDSVASNNICDVLEEARLAALLQRTRRYFISAEQVLFAATLGGAQALGIDNETGSIEAGKQADLCVISLSSLTQQPIYDVYAALIFASSAHDVVQTIIAGQIIYEDGRVQTVDEDSATARLKETAHRMNE
jgi:5-methylthioadenosine/S-adenosylhomocysteine deaminase